MTQTALISASSLAIGILIGFGSASFIKKPDKTISSTNNLITQGVTQGRPANRTLASPSSEDATSPHNSFIQHTPSFLPDYPTAQNSANVLSQQQIAFSRQTNNTNTQAGENRHQDWQREARETARRAFDTRIDSLALALRLRPDQVETLRTATANIFNSDTNQGWRVYRELNEKIEQSLNTMLTAEQKQLHSAYQERERNARLDIRTNIEYSMMDVAVGLTPQQSDTVFQTIAAINQLENNPTYLQSLGTQDRDAVRQAIQQQKLDAMSRILSPEQMNVYRGFLETQRAFGRGFMRRE